MRVEGPSGPAGEINETKRWDDENQEVHDIFESGISMVEQKLSNALPEGYYVKIEA